MTPPVRVPARNRVTPYGDIVAVAARGSWTGNRGRLHAGRDIVRTSASRAWLICRLHFRGRRIAQWDPHHYTPLFFTDEATALAAGHRPCTECRRGDSTEFREAAGVKSAPELDSRLAAERGRIWSAPWSDLPDGTFVVLREGGGPVLVAGDRVRPFDLRTLRYPDPETDSGAARHRPRTGSASVITPATTVAALRAGYVPRHA